METLILKIQEFLKTYKGNLVLNHDDPNAVSYTHLDVYKRQDQEKQKTQQLQI